MFSMLYNRQRQLLKIPSRTHRRHHHHHRNADAGDSDDDERSVPADIPPAYSEQSPEMVIPNYADAVRSPNASEGLPLEGATRTLVFFGAKISLMLVVSGSSVLDGVNKGRVLWRNR